jgi:lactoylglutathione lyase
MKFKKLTPNLVVRDVARSMEFYRNVLGFQTSITVPEQGPYVFGAVTNGSVEIFFNDQKAVLEEYPALGSKPIGGSLTLFIEIEGVEELFRKVQQHGVKITMPMKDQFYGMREFAMADPEGWVITFAERINKQ